MRDSRLGRWIACCTAFALLCPWLTVTPAGAQAQSETPEAAAAITIMEHSCSLSAREFKATLPEVKVMLARAGHRSVLLAQNEAGPSPAPTASPEPYETVFP
ncbi:MAG: hypothetical protein ACREMT_10115, partial [Vulcanimicrobiaceae bacterium]